MKICVITDNLYIFENFREILKRKPQPDCEFDYFYAPWNKAFCEKFGTDGEMKPLRLKEQTEEFFGLYDLFISLHCKQLFPEIMVKNHRCINVHPGYNPYNRGWFPQVFGIINKLPIGVTVHEIDEELDHGPIIYQEKLELHSDETSKDIYNRILALEMKLLDEHFEDILYNRYEAKPMSSEGNINYKADFDALCEMDLNKPATYGEVIDFLKAMTFTPYNNAYFIDKDGKKVFVGITVKKEG